MNIPVDKTERQPLSQNIVSAASSRPETAYMDDRRPEAKAIRELQAGMRLATPVFLSNRKHSGNYRLNNNVC